MFNFFKKTPKPNQQPDQVFLSTGAKFLNVGKTIKQLIDNQIIVVLVYFFQKTNEDLKTVLNTFNLDFEAIDNTQSKPNQSVLLLSAPNFSSARVVLENLKNVNLHFLVVEHYPLPVEDAQLITKIGEISMDIPITFYSALDEPLMKIFGSENIQRLMRAMGMNEEEGISHSMISKSIVNAQQKIAKKVITDLKAESAEEWFSKNMPMS